MVQLSHLYMTTGKTIALTICTFVGKVMSLAFWYAVKVCHSCSSKEEASFNFMAAVSVCSDFGAQENKFCHCFHFFPIYLPWSDGTGCHDLSFLNVAFSASSFTLIKGLFSSCLLSAIRVVSSAYLRLLIFLPAVKNPPAIQEMWRPRFDPWVGKIPWRMKWQPTPVFLPGKSHGQKNLAGYSPWGCKRVRHDLVTKQQHASSLLQRHTDKISSLFIWNKIEMWSESQSLRGRRGHSTQSSHRWGNNRPREAEATCPAC